MVQEEGRGKDNGRGMKRRVMRVRCTDSSSSLTPGSPIRLSFAVNRNDVDARGRLNQPKCPEVSRTTRKSREEKEGEGTRYLVSFAR